jgi:hypothetical protein
LAILSDLIRFYLTSARLYAFVLLEPSFLGFPKVASNHNQTKMTNQTKAKDISDLELTVALENLNRSITDREHKLDKLKRQQQWLYRLLRQRFEHGGGFCQTN